MLHISRALIMFKEHYMMSRQVEFHVVTGKQQRADTAAPPDGTLGVHDRSDRMPDLVLWRRNNQIVDLNFTELKMVYVDGIFSSG